MNLFITVMIVLVLTNVVSFLCGTMFMFAHYRSQAPTTPTEIADMVSDYLKDVTINDAAADASAANSVSSS